MYVVKGIYWMCVNGVKQAPAPDLHFHTAMGMARWALNQGGMRKGAWGNHAPGPHEMERASIPYSGSCDWDLRTHYFSPAQVDAMKAAQSRYRGILRYFREVEPGWKPDTSVSPTGEIHWADNSIERREIDKHGNKRTVQVAAPSGDLCF
jgi:hypothetical protein